MPHGKPAGVRCVQLSAGNLCLLFGKPERPTVCSRLRPNEEMCGNTRDEALVYLSFLERATAPVLPTPPGPAATAGGNPRTAPAPAR